MTLARVTNIRRKHKAHSMGIASAHTNARKHAETRLTKPSKATKKPPCGGSHGDQAVGSLWSLNRSRN